MSESKRDQDWLESLYRDHYRAVLAYAARRLGPDEADDIAAAVFLTTWQKRDAVPVDVRPWLLRTAANHILHAQRGEARRGRLSTRLLDDPVLSAGVEWVDDCIEEALDARSRVHLMLAELPPPDAEIMRLAAWDGLEPAAIAAVLGISGPAARVRLHRARRRAEAILARLDHEASARITQTHSLHPALGAQGADQGVHR